MTPSKAQRSAAAKKAAETRRKNQEAEQAGQSEEQQYEQIEGVVGTRTRTPEELAAQEHALRVEHNARTGGGPVHEGELQAQRDKHNERTGG